MSYLPIQVTAAIVKRRRIAILMHDEYEDRDKQRSGPQGPKRHGPRFDWEAFLERTSREDFRKMFRMHRSDFEQLLAWLRPSLSTRHPDKALGNSGAIAAPTRLAVALRLLAGGSVWDVKMAYNVYSNSACYECVWRTIDAIETCPMLDTSFPRNDRGRFIELERGFAARSRDHTLRGAVAAVDGCIFAQKNPGRHVKNPKRYYCARKKKFGIHCEAIADADRRILWYNMSSTRLTHDYMAFRSTSLGKFLYDTGLPDPFWILADNAYVCSRSIISPGSNDDFNYEHSKLRMAVECAFGEVVRRWGILWRPLEVRFDRRAAVIGVCMKLHNFCVAKRIEATYETETWSPNRGHPGGVMRPPAMDLHCRPVEMLQATFTNQIGTGPPAREKDKTDTSRREVLEAAVCEAGLKRPDR